MRCDGHREIANQIGDTDYRHRCLLLIAAYELFTGEHDAAIRTLETFVSVAATADPSALPDGETHLGILEIYVGRLQSSRQRLERLYKHDLQDLKDSRFARFLYVRNVDIGNVLSWAQWLTGSPDTSARTAQATVEQALKTKHELSLSNALAVAACPAFFLSGRYQECGRYVAMLDEQVMRHGIAIWRPTALFYRAALAYTQGDASSGTIDDLERAIEEFRNVNYLARMPYYLSVLADALTIAGGSAKLKRRSGPHSIARTPRTNDGACPSCCESGPPSWPPRTGRARRRRSSSSRWRPPWRSAPCRGGCARQTIWRSSGASGRGRMTRAGCCCPSTTSSPKASQRATLWSPPTSSPRSHALTVESCYDLALRRVWDGNSP